MSIRPLTLGTLSFANNVIQGPLAGISCAPFRRLIWEYSQPAFSCTEMISCKTILFQPKLLHRFTAIDPLEGPVCFQLSGNCPKELGEATQRVTALGAQLINLNCGCPVQKIRSKGAGSQLLSEPQHLYKLIVAMKQNTHLPVSIKIRVDGNSTEAFNQDVSRAVMDAGADFLIVHGRHWTESYDIPCHYDQIQFFVESLPIPVIGNGDIFCLQSLQRMLSTGCAGVMVGRASVGQPWLIRHLIDTSQHQSPVTPTATEIGTMLVRHVTELATLLQSETFAVLQARKFTKYYARHFHNKALFCEAINQCNNLKEFQQLCQLHTY